jgi:hypothetical protein
VRFYSRGRGGVSTSTRLLIFDFAHLLPFGMPLFAHQHTGTSHPSHPQSSPARSGTRSFQALSSTAVASSRTEPHGCLSVRMKSFT